MYNREKIINTLCDVANGSKDIKPYVVICCPRRDLKETPAQKLNDEMQMHVSMAGFSHGYCDIGGESVDVARNYLIEQALASGAKYMFFIGEDTVLPYDAFIKLHETAEKNPDAMVCGVYYIKLSVPMIMIRNSENHILVPNVDRGQIIEAWQTGLDACIIPVALLQKIKDSDPEIPLCCVGNNIPGLPFIGEDNFFAHRWHTAGYRILVNTDVQCLHMDLASGKYTAHPDINEKDYITQIPLTGRLTMADKEYIDKRWTRHLPEEKKEEKKAGKKSEVAIKKDGHKMNFQVPKSEK